MSTISTSHKLMLIVTHSKSYLFADLLKAGQVNYTAEAVREHYLEAFQACINSNSRSSGLGSHPVCSA